MDRREFLRHVALGTLAAGSTIALGSAGGGAQASQASRREVASKDSYYPGTVYVEGHVLRREPSRLTLVDPESGLEEIVLSARTSVWKGVHTTAAVINAGDHLSLRGYPTQGGPIEAIAIWVNIAWHRGKVIGLGRHSVFWTAENGSSGRFRVAAHTSLHRGDAPAEPFQGQLQVGQLVEALGAFDRPGGVLEASRIWVLP